jgi:D-serine deaminase-like pyridoxal phosphate-dependent protein
MAYCAGMPALDQATKGLDPPLAVVDLAAFDDNADDLVRRAAGRPIRVASKSVRCRTLLDRVLARPGFAGLLCYSLREALWLCAQGTSDDLVVGYPTADRGALAELAADPVARERITLMADSAEQLDLVDEAVGTGHPELRVCLDLDASWRPLSWSAVSGAVHIGVRRSPLYAPEQAVSLARAVLARPGFRLTGAMSYEAQIAGLGDAPPGRPLRAAALRLIQRLSVAELRERRGETIRLLQALAPLEFVNGGGTGSLETTAADPSVTEVTAGSGLMGPTLFDAYRRFSPRPALLYALPVVRRPAAQVATLFSGGYIASGPPGRDRQPSPYLPAGLKLIGTEGAGEVQTPVRGAAAATLRVGDRVWLRHAKAGELAERFNDYHLIESASLDGAPARPVPTYRGEGQCFG